MLFEVSHALVAGETYEIEACADETCRSATITVPTADDVVSSGAEGLEVFPSDDRIQLLLPGGDDGRARTVSLTVVDGAGDRIVDAEAEPDFEEQRPNGPDCPPVCWVATVPV